jgi:hypothetical protein
MSQQEYDVVLSPKGVMPLVTSPMRTFSRPKQTLDQSCLRPSTHLNLEGAPSPLCSPSHHLCATAYESRFFLREIFILVMVQWACNELAYVQSLLSPFHYHHLQPQRTSVYHIPSIVFHPCIPSKKSYNYFGRHQSSHNPYRAP